MTKRTGIAAGVLATAIGVAAIFAFLSGAPDDEMTGPTALYRPEPRGVDDLNKLDSTAASPESSRQLPQLAPHVLTGPSADAQREYLGGTSAKGRVKDVYVRVAEGVLLELSRAMPHQRDGWRYVDIEFPDSPANGVASARALVPEHEMAVGVGDVVEMRFAHKGNTSIFPVKERDKVTALVAKADTQLAQDYQRRIVARTKAEFPPGLASAFKRQGEAPATLSEALTDTPSAPKSTQ